MSDVRIPVRVGAADSVEVPVLLWRLLRNIPRLRFDFLGTASFRFAVAFGVVFGISATLFAITIWEQTVIALNAEARETVQSDALVLAARYNEAGLLALAKAIRLSSEQTAHRHGLYMLVDKDGNLVSGNMHRWPKGIVHSHVWYKESFKQSKHRIQAIFRSYPLPDGFRLLVGQNTNWGLRVLKILKAALLSAASEVLLLALIGGAMMRTLLSRALGDLNKIAAAVSRGELNMRIRRSARGSEIDQISATVNKILDRTASLLDGVRNVTSAISHDLRTPVTKVRMRLEEAVKLSADRPDILEKLALAEGDLFRVMAIFEALLRIAEIESGARRSAFCKFELSPRLEAAVELYQAAAEERGVTLTLAMTGVIAMVGDPDMIQQAIVNLLDNALKFSSPQGTIRVEAVSDDRFAMVTVADNGPGIAESDRARVGERFFRTEVARSTPGSGLGLSLVASVCQLHDGLFSIEDNNPGVIATLRLQLGEEWDKTICDRRIGIEGYA
ncbi:MAG: sensor histidine kinase [Acidiphilium sp.]